MCTDDVNIFIKGKSLDIIKTEIKCKLDKVFQWFASNLLSLNVKRLIT